MWWGGGAPSPPHAPFFQPAAPTRADPVGHSGFLKPCAAQLLIQVFQELGMGEEPVSGCWGHEWLPKPKVGDQAAPEAVTSKAWAEGLGRRDTLPGVSPGASR